MTYKAFDITQINAREIIDSRGNPTVEVDIRTSGGFLGRASVPSGASTGLHEALELRDGDKKRFHGKGVLKAVDNIHSKIAAELIGMDVRNQRDIDSKLINLDGSTKKSKLGANAILGVSLASAKTASVGLGISLFYYLGGITIKRLPVPMMNVINGGKHAGNKLAIQEFLIMPVGFHSYSDSFQAGVEIYTELSNLLKQKYGSSAINVGDEGGYAPPMVTTNEALESLWTAIENAGYTPTTQVWLGVDAAASSFYEKENKVYTIDSKKFSADELIDYYGEIISSYKIKSIEDPLDEEDFKAFSEFTSKYGNQLQVVGDDLLVTQLERLKKGVNLKSANTLLLKVNQVGSLSEAIDAGMFALEHGWRVVVSHRSGETEDTFIADLAVGLHAHMIKAGAPARGERIVKYNQLKRIEDKLYPNVDFWGPILQ